MADPAQLGVASEDDRETCKGSASVMPSPRDASVAVDLLAASREVLGWSAFRELLAGFTVTAVGHDRALAIIPHSTLTAVRARLAATRQARWALTAVGVPPWDGIEDVRPVLVRAAAEGALIEGPRLAALARTLVAAERLAAYGRRIGGGAPDLAEQWRLLPTCPDLAAGLAHALDSEGRVLDRASPRLRAVRRGLQLARAQLGARLDALLASPALAPALQERYVTVRNGRYVLPVRGDARRAIRGIVHDRSASGATLFIEPDEVIDLNNQCTQRSLEERDEELRVLRELTHWVYQHLPELERLIGGLGDLDLVFAQATLAERLDASEPEVSAGGEFNCRAARHPLLVAQAWGGGAPVVPIELRLPTDRSGLLITGPNAGGKTVALKTCGLLVLMAQAGCHIPANPGSRLPVLSEVFAIIGDEQSLAHNLSTFSAFVAQIRQVLTAVRPSSLVLLDELGAGTDPAEGAALGAAILEDLLDQGARVIATTHLEPLKVFAEFEPRLDNAAVAFDAERLEPTFRLEYGHPGPSYTLVIGERLGLSASLIRRARAHLSDASQRLEALLGELAARQREAAGRAAETARQEAEARAVTETARRHLAQVEQDATRLRQAARAEARALLADTRRLVGQELEQLKAEERTRQRAQETYRRLRTAEAELPDPSASAPDAPPRAGEVRVRGLGLRGRIVTEDDSTVTVQAGSLTVRVSRSEVEPAAAVAASSRLPAVSLPARYDVPRELHLLGRTRDEARAAVEKFLDDAVLAGHSGVRLIHGKGTGTLKRTVEACLRAHPLVSRFRTGEVGEGGGGVTVVELLEGRQA